MPICVARHERGWPKRILRSDPDLRDYYFQSYVFRSLYHDQLHRWLRLFPRRQLMIIPSDRFFENEAGTMSDVADFLGLEPFEFRSAPQLQRRWDAGAANAAGMPQAYPAMAGSTRRLLADFFESHHQQLYSLTGENYGWK